ncbi:hypothetical protein VRK_27200 [Vibrio sp. MEBiC08052]|nr:hypothetical protein VRK_27200 [Vibrio sp. MEBiC08052]
MRLTDEYYKHLQLAGFYYAMDKESVYHCQNGLSCWYDANTDHYSFFFQPI